MANPLDYLKNLIPDDTNIFGASPDSNLKQLALMGLLGDEAGYKKSLENANKQSIFQGLLNTGLSYAAQPQNQGYGSVFPYLAKAGLQGINAAQKPFDKLASNAMTNAQLKALLAKQNESIFAKESQSKYTPESVQKAIRIKQDGGSDEDARAVLVALPEKTNPAENIQKRVMFVVNPETNEQYPTYFDKEKQRTMVEVNGKAVPFSYNMFGDKPEQKAQIGNLNRFNKDMKKKDFDSLENQITTEETSLRNLASYAKRTKDLPKGFKKIANKISAASKTFFDFNEYTEDEINQPLSEGQQQALLGQIRESVVGTGVMTEFDAQRVIDRLGGLQASAFTNPEVVAKAIGEIMAEKYQSYLTNVKQYNRAVTSGGYYGEGYNTKKPIEFDQNIFYGANAPASIATENKTQFTTTNTGLPTFEEIEAEQRRRRGGK